MNFASNYAFISSKNKSKPQPESLFDMEGSDSGSQNFDLNVFVVTFEGVKAAEKQLAGGDPYVCHECGAILNQHSKVLWPSDMLQTGPKKQMKLALGQALWECEFCSFYNILKMQKEEVPGKDDMVYMLEGEHNEIKSQNDSTIVFCIDTSGSMNTTSSVEGKVDLKYGLSQEQLEMLRQFMQPGDQAQLEYLPGVQNQNKTFISRIQCILSAIEAQISELKTTHPYKKIGFVTFGSEVAALGDSKCETVDIVGDKLYKKEAIVQSLHNFKLCDPISESHAVLLNKISKIQAKGQTALGPALISALQIAEKGGPGSSVILCTDGLANIGVGQLEPYDEEKKKFYAVLGEQAKAKNISVNIITIKGQGCKIEAIGQLAQLTNGNIKIVNPQKLSEDFANVLKDEVVGLNVLIKVILHKGMHFKNEAPENIKAQGCILQKKIANATKNTRVSFEYSIKSQQELEKLHIDLNKLNKVPFQAQIQYTSSTGGKFLRVISKVCDTTEEKEAMEKEANLGVVHHRITSQTAALYKKGNYKESQRFNSRWANYLDRNFQDSKYKEHQNKFAEKNQRLNKAIRHRHRKSIQKKVELKEEVEEDELDIIRNHSDIESDEDQRELVDNLMERQRYSICKKFQQRSPSLEKSQSSRKKGKEKKEAKRKHSRSGSIVDSYSSGSRKKSGRRESVSSRGSKGNYRQIHFELKPEEKKEKRGGKKREASPVIKK